MRIVAVDPQDASMLASFRRLLSEYEEYLPPDLRIPDLDVELQTLPERYPPSSAALLIALESGTEIGCVAVKRMDATTAEIKRLYVVPNARRSGAGRALVEAAIEFARERAYARVVLDTQRERLAAAYRLYLSLGFTACASYGGPIEYANPTYMELAL